MTGDKNSETTNFAANLIHDISNPNNSILMNASLLESIFKDAMRLLKDDSGQFHEVLAGIPPNRIEEAVTDLFSGIKTSAQTIQKIVDELKIFSR